MARGLDVRGNVVIPEKRLKFKMELLYASRVGGSLVGAKRKFLVPFC